jgi:hypothetical protein
VHEQDAGMGARHHRLREDGPVHVRVAARLEHQRAAQVIGVTPHPLAPVEHRLATWRRESVDDQAQRLTGGVRVDCFQPEHWTPREHTAQHEGTKWTRSTRSC